MLLKNELILKYIVTWNTIKMKKKHIEYKPDFYLYAIIKSAAVHRMNNSSTS